MLPFDFGIGSFMIATVAALIASMGLVLFLGGKTYVSRTFAFATTVVVIWQICMVAQVVTTPEWAFLGNFIIRLCYVMGIFIALSFSYFCIVFTSDKKPTSWIPITLEMIGLGIMPVILYTDILFKDGIWRGEIKSVGVQIWGTPRGAIPFFYEILFVLLIGGGLVLIYKKMKQTEELEPKNQLKFMFWTLTIGFIPSSFFSMVLPSLNIYQYTWVGSILGIFWISVLAYSMMKYNQMNIRTALTEILVLMGIFLLFVNIFI